MFPHETRLAQTGVLRSMNPKNNIRYKTLLMHVFIQYLTKHNVLDAYLEALLRTHRCKADDLEYTARMYNNMDAIIGFISWNPLTLASDETTEHFPIPRDTWIIIAKEWKELCSSFEKVYIPNIKIYRAIRKITLAKENAADAKINVILNKHKKVKK